MIKLDMNEVRDKGYSITQNLGVSDYR